MTREEALKQLGELKFALSGTDEQFLDIVALDMAIKALEQDSCNNAVSRQAVDILVDELARAISDERWSISRGRNTVTIMQDILDLPSVTPQPKTGHWIIEKWNNKEHYSCSSCQHVVDYEPCYHYCPYCGAKMIGSQESEE